MRKHNHNIKIHPDKRTTDKESARNARSRLARIQNYECRREIDEYR
jgi:hypothetical protein